MTNCQPGILDEVPPLARYLTFSLLPGVKAQEALSRLQEVVSIDNTVVGVGHSVILAARANLKRLRDFPVIVGHGIEIPSTPAALWFWLKGDDRGELIHRTRALEQALEDYFSITSIVDAFKYGNSQDMTGYIDGTENPVGDEAVNAAILQGQGVGLDGSSFVAIQQWVHDLDAFESMSQKQQDNTFGRRKSDNEEIDSAPPSAHVKRTAQESFEPEAFILRRSMPWADEQAIGLMFVAFGKSFDAFEALLTRMSGLDDGITDALFTISQPVTGSYFWCPPIHKEKLDLSVIVG